MDSDALEELNPYTFFASAALCIGRLVNPAQLRTVAGTAIATAIVRLAFGRTSSRHLPTARCPTS